MWVSFWNWLKNKRKSWMWKFETWCCWLFIFHYGKWQCDPLVCIYKTIIWFILIHLLFISVKFGGVKSTQINAWVTNLRTCNLLIHLSNLDVFAMLSTYQGCKVFGHSILAHSNMESMTSFEVCKGMNGSHNWVLRFYLFFSVNYYH
jgi:hypothetical protein